MLSFSPVGPSTSAITTGGSHRQISCTRSLLRVKLSSQTPRGQVFTTDNGLIYERVCCTRMYWNSSTGESGPEATALRPSNRECFLVMRRSLFLMAATILSSEPWCVLIEYRWQPGTEVEETWPQMCPSLAVSTTDACSSHKGRNTSSESHFHIFHGLLK